MTSEIIAKRMMARLIELCPPVNRAWWTFAKDNPIESQSLITALVASVGEDLEDRTRQWISFCEFWAQRGHVQHREPIHGMTRLDDWRKCPDPLCMSLLGTLLDLEKELPAPHANPVLP